MGVAENKQLVRSFYEAANRGDMDACFGIIDETVRWTNIGSTRLSGTFNGKPQLMEQLLGPLFENLKSGITSEIVSLVGEDDIVVALTNGTAETIAGEPYNNSYCQVIRIRDGKFVEVTEYCDTQLIASVFGNG
jgi:ketosteroid isomerase-like protein